MLFLVNPLSNIFNLLKGIGDFFVGLASTLKSFFTLIYHFIEYVTKVDVIAHTYSRFSIVPFAIAEVLFVIWVICVFIKFIGQRS